jgi:hypothetical protein
VIPIGEATALAGLASVGIALQALTVERGVETVKRTTGGSSAVTTRTS